VDDGPTTIKDSVRMILEAEKIGVDKIIVTPHYKKNVYDSDKVVNNFTKSSRELETSG